MGHNCELEEGEMDCSAHEGVADLDVVFSYIDKKVQDVLGHLQKDFTEGALDLFGQKISVYGSFLPPYKPSQTVSSSQRSSVGNHAEQRLSNSLPGKDVVQKFQSLPTTSCGLVSNQDPQNCQTSRSLLDQAPGKVAIIKGNTKIPDHKPIRVRIKMGSEILSQKKVTMVCTNLGLEDSPNVPPQNSQDDRSRMPPHVSLEKTIESPYRILREMTATPVPKDLLMSPLPRSLLLVMDKEREYTLLDNKPVVRSEKEPSVQAQKKFSDVLGCKETPSGKRRKAVDCFDWDKASLIGDMKKQKVLNIDQIARENSTCGLGGASSTNVGLTTKSNVQKGINKDGKSDPRVPFVKSNKMNAVGKYAEKEKMTYPTKLKQNSSKNRLGDTILSNMRLEDAVNTSQKSMDLGVNLAVAPSSTTLDLDNWAECDSCRTWRLLPFGLKPEQLPDKWLCSMQTWLPGMNHCGVSEKETTNAIIAFNGTKAHGPETGVKFLSDARNADKSYRPLTSGSLPNLIEKKSTVKNLSQGISSNILVDAAKPVRSKSHPLKIKNLKRPLGTRDATWISTDLGVSQDFVQDKIYQKVKCQSAGTGSQIKIKMKKDSDKQENEGSKQIKTGNGNKLCRDGKEVHWKQDLGWTSAEKKKKRHGNDFYTYGVERDTEKKILSYKTKPYHKPQLTSGSGSLCTKSQNSIQEIQAHQSNEFFQADGSQELWNSDASCRYFSGGIGQISGVETSSSLKVYGAHKIGRRHVEEVKSSPVESVSSPPARSSYPGILASAGESISRENKNLKYGDAGSKTVNSKNPLSQEADCEISSTTYPRNSKQPKPEVCKQNSKFGELPCTMNKILENRAEIKNFSVITHETMDRSCQGVNDILQEAEKQRKLADCFKSSGFDYEHKKANFKAARKFLLGASLLDMCSNENMEGRKMSHVEAYHTAAKLSESCAHQYETSQEMAEAALAYKCMEVACMRVVYGKSLGMSGEWTKLQKRVQMTPQGESPSSSLSDVDNFSHQRVIDKSGKTKRGLSHVVGNLLPVARSQQNFVPLFDFTENMNLAMEASAKSQNAFRAFSSTSEETEDGDCVSAIKKVVDFSFHDVEALMQTIEHALDVLRSSRPRGPKC